MTGPISSPISQLSSPSNNNNNNNSTGHLINLSIIAVFHICYFLDIQAKYENVSDIAINQNHQPIRGPLGRSRPRSGPFSSHSDYLSQLLWAQLSTLSFTMLYLSTAWLYQSVNRRHQFGIRDLICRLSERIYIT
ncbi:hypothetical protein GE21DRAFT_1341787, partial [Neurospora crassa]